MISYDYWRERFALDPAVVGKKVVLDNAPFTIIGVTPPEFYGLQPGERVDISVPITTMSLVWPEFAATGGPADVLTSPFRNWLLVMGRLNPGTNRIQAEAGLQTVFRQSMREAAESLSGTLIDTQKVRRTFLEARLRSGPWRTGTCCTSPTVLKAALDHHGNCWSAAARCLRQRNKPDAGARQCPPKRDGSKNGPRRGQAASDPPVNHREHSACVREWSTCRCCGLRASRSLLVLMSNSRDHIVLSVRPDSSVLGFTLVISLLTAFLFGMVPAWRGVQLEGSPGSSQGTRNIGQPAGRSRLGKVLVIAQVAVSLILMIAAGLLAHSLANLKDFYPGFDKQNVLLFSVNPRVIGYQEIQLFHFTSVRSNG